tara:strand:+ start:11850 stop:12773 length:924 start_codon:yes stop_codon:yes gene_type:complete
MRNKYLYIILLSFIYSSAGASYEYGHSARSVSLSSSLVADNYNNLNSFINPASLNQSKGKIYGLSYFIMSLDRSLQTFYYSQKLAGNAGVSAAILRTSSGEFMGRDSFNNPTNELSNTEYYGLLSFGVGTKNGTGIGLSTRIHYSNLYVNENHIDKYTGNSITLDFGGIININPKWRIGFKFQNFLNPYLNWDIDRGDGLSNSYEEVYPSIISFGSMFNINQNSKLFIQQDTYDKSKFNQTKIAYEYLGFDNFDLRCGYDFNKDITLGFGYNFYINQLPIILDYAVDFGNQGEGLSHLFTWSIGLNE